jgi:NAD(P)H-hydrate epimerase
VTWLDALPRLADPPTATAAEMARADRVASEELGVPLVALMENAGRQIAAVARLLLGGVAGRRIVALVGRGNNGGDALCAARHLYGWGADARVVVCGDPAALRELPAVQARALEAIGVRVARFAPDGPDELDGAELLLDGLLGYSASGAPRDDVADCIRLADRSRVPILAIDLPSGLDPDTGVPRGVAIRAACTVTLALPKRGLLAPEAAPLVGALVLADIGIPAAAYGRPDVAGLYEGGDLVRLRP